MFQRVGAAAYKADLSNTIALCEALGNPQAKFRSIHIAGTNGKGSTSHMLASVLQSAGYKTGLYTSPHLKDFTERIRINGVPVASTFVVEFVNRIQPHIERIKPSFFEITVAMAFEYFAQQEVDVAVIETGLGGRLDSTNVIHPVLSVITNIGFDHKDILGDTLEKIASEKAGIIKPEVPVVVSERQPEIEYIFREKANLQQSPLTFASDVYTCSYHENCWQVKQYDQVIINALPIPLKGNYQARNIAGVFQSVDVLRQCGFVLPKDQVIEGLTGVVQQTGLKGRWQQIGEKPLIICDTGHNADGIRELVRQIRQQPYQKLFMVIGTVKDKEPDEVLRPLPTEAYYYFCEASIPRAMNADVLKQAAQRFGLNGEVERDVNAAIAKAKQAAGAEDFIFIGGSTFVVAEIAGL